MESTEVFSSKAEKYARYRWVYAAEAVKTIFDVSGITEASVVADIGAGTGILTREFVGKVQRVYAVEPNPEMRAIAGRAFKSCPSCRIIDGRSDATTLEVHSIDLITVAQAIHWFDPEATKQEFYRLLKPGGWLAICRNYGTDDELGVALQEVYSPETDTESLMIGKNIPISHYFCGDNYLKQEFPFTNLISWDEFIGALSTASYAPDEGSPQYDVFERAAKKVFDEFSTDQHIERHGVTELYVGQITCSSP